ncbi:hypothetical protein B0H16DRAFT_1448173 [Mycena metata]|uniref:Uncharacterized protein n=1 Tax=Mycena metata TaxID=1033252 RepID=A0AAD7KBK7_9AGAR|nr:hypothetical protein B0H16DRAFT_1448173 [Mycena metata]
MATSLMLERLKSLLPSPRKEHNLVTPPRSQNIESVACSVQNWVKFISSWMAYVFHNQPPIHIDITWSTGSRSSDDGPGIIIMSPLKCISSLATASTGEIIATFPKPTERDGWTHEFINCDATNMLNIHAVRKELRQRLKSINFLANSMVECGEIEETLDNHLAMRYFARYVLTKEFRPLLLSAREQGQRAHVMTVLGAGMGLKIPTDDLGVSDARGRTIRMLHGAAISTAAMKGMMRGAAYNDGLVAWFGAHNPDIAFTHIYPGQVNTPGKLFYPGWLLAPLTWNVGYLRAVVSQVGT